MGHASKEEIHRHIKSYLLVFAALAVLTVATVLVSYLKVSFGYALIIALFIAGIKASLVAAYFMHLISERKIIILLLVMTVILLLHLLALPFWTETEAIGHHVS